MSLFEIQTSQSKDGMKKTIDKNSSDVALDILQRGIYAYPEKSTVRELVSNAFDAIVERDTAIKIIKGLEKVEDHYDVTKIDDIYHASGWDPDYYDLNHLSDDKNIYVRYTEGTLKDTISIKDNGIGLGHDRLIGYFQLAYSSKRTQKGVNGRWGLGNKSALSLGIDSYTVVNIYNGRKFMFEVFIDNVISTTPKFGKKGKNDYITVEVPQPIEDGTSVLKSFKFYYEETDEKNGLEVIVPIKKYQKKSIIDAIETQLMYIPNVIFTIKSPDKLTPQQQDIQAEIIYRDNNIIISKSKVFDSPHILLGAGEGLINYGMVDFDALELDRKRGSVGLILDINEVEVTPSRESVVWSKKTRDALIRKYNDIVETATKFINKELNSVEDYLDWIQKASAIKSSLLSGPSSSSTNNILQELASIVDADSIDNIVYTTQHNNKIFTKKYSNDISKMLGKNVQARVIGYSQYSKKVTRDAIKTTSTFKSMDVYFTNGNANKYTDRFINEHINGQFILVSIKENTDNTTALELLLKSKNCKSYDDIEVPQDIYDSYILSWENSDQDDDDEVARDPAYLSKLRKQNKEILLHVDSSYETMSKTTVRISELPSLYPDSKNIFGIYSRDFTIVRYLKDSLPDFLLKNIFANYGQTNIEHLNSIGINVNLNKLVQFALVSKENLKYLDGKLNFHPIDKFFIKKYNKNTGNIEFADTIKLLMTSHILARYLRESELSLASFLNNCKEYENEQELYSVFNKEFIQLLHLAFLLHGKGDPMNFLRTAAKFQLETNDFIKNDIKNDFDKIIPDCLAETIDEINSVDIVYTNIINKFLEYLEYYSKFAVFFNQISSYGFELSDFIKSFKIINDKMKDAPKDSKIFDSIVFNI